VFSGEIDELTRRIAEAGEGKRFIIHGGDCVERFADCNPSTIKNKLKILLQMSVILTHASRLPVLRIGRIAGQFFKPRSQETETVNGQEVPTYRGDTVNGFKPTPASRKPDPERLAKGYFHATATLNYIRAMIDGGFADLHQPYSWNLHDVEQSEHWGDYKTILDKILDAIHFMEAFGGLDSEKLGKIEFYTSHEGLHLDYESALTRRADNGRHYNLGAHMLWLGERTRHIDEAHVEYFRGIQNPIGVKISARARPEELARLAGILNPDNVPGRLTFITRMGAETVAEALPPVIEAVQGAGRSVVWSCDPMHGNTVTTESGVKTRRFEDVLSELERTFAVHRAAGTVLAGVHFELTGDNVTECTGGPVRLTDSDLASRYESYCDPRLNYAQSMEMAFRLARLFRGNK
jgi:3-deoxy-7-phosphoheptulonate synthase